MLYTKIHPQSFLGPGEEDFYVFTAIYGHGGHLVPWCGTIYTDCQYPFDRRLHVKSGENWSSGLKEEEVLSLHNFMHVHRADNP